MSTADRTDMNLGASHASVVSDSLKLESADDTHRSYMPENTGRSPAQNIIYSPGFHKSVREGNQPSQEKDFILLNELRLRSTIKANSKPPIRFDSVVHLLTLPKR